MKKLLRRPEIELRTGLARSTIYDMMKDGRFPKPIKLGGRAVAWLEVEINDWIEDQITQREDIAR